MGRGLNFYPKAFQPGLRMKTRGEYKGGYPRGAVVHYTAGRFRGGVGKAVDTIKGGIKNGFAFLCISYDGIVVQAHPVQQWGYHAGKSLWKRLFGSVSDDLIGIEMNCAGKLEVKRGRYYSWYGEEIPAENVRIVDKSYGCPAGAYHKYTPEQEAALVDLLLWLKKNDPTGRFDFDFVLGHHEVSGVKGIGVWRKTDPGGSLSMTMTDFREFLKQKYYATENKLP